jgi:2-polyprenyl-3-methyl-5-hydroxy-6-metoxy-1,4-benzoquinol methylase
MEMKQCLICHNLESNKIHTAREMMFGTRHEFDYLECGMCGCLQLINPPQNMSEYYPQDYYSFQKHGMLMSFIRRRWAARSCGKFSLIGWLVTELYFPNNAISAVHRLSLSKNSKILEFGSGSGRLLLDLHSFGYANLIGADPFVQEDIVYSNGVKIFKKTVEQISGRYDLIMLHHAFEHMPNPGWTLKKLVELLNENGRIILRIPIASSLGWKTYGVNWVHLDAPRHFFLHTHQSIQLLAEQSGLEIETVIFESEEISITGSESYSNDIPLTDSRYPLSSTSKRLFSWFKRWRAKSLAQEMNKNRIADLCCFYLKKSIRN